MRALIVSLVAYLLASGTALFAQPLPSTPTASSTATRETYADPRPFLPAEVSQPLQSVLADLVRESIPASYTDNRQWGKTKKVYAGVKLRPEGWKLETERRWKEVNHGDWQHYQLDLVNPDERLQVNVGPILRDEAGRFHFDLQILADVQLSGRWSRWNYGVQAISLSYRGNATVALRIQGSVGIEITSDNLMPMVVIDPRIDAATLEIHRFELDRISKLGSDLAEPIGRGLRHVLEERLLEQQASKLPEKLNAKIDKRRDRLRFSAGAWLEPFMRQAHGDR